MTGKKNYYIIREDVIPESMYRTLIIKKALEENPNLSILEATKLYGLSRSAFYKYKDLIFPIDDFKKDSILSMYVNVDDVTGILGKVIQVINEEKCSVITIHQAVPVNKKATIMFSLNINLSYTDIDVLKAKLEALEYVNKVKVMGFSV